MCVKTIGAVSTALVDCAEQPAKKKSKKETKKKPDAKAQKMNSSLREERLERLAREWVPHPSYWGGNPMHVPWLFPETPETD